MTKIQNTKQNPFRTWMIGFLNLFSPPSASRRRGRGNSKLEIRNFERGFTLIEMVVAIGIFSVIVISAIGIELGVANAQLKANGIQSILDNIRFSLELITKEMRTGTSYSITQNCTTRLSANSGPEITFTTSTGQTRVYFLDAATGLVMRATTAIGPADCDGLTKKVQPFTADDVAIQSLNFQTFGNTFGPNDGQPWILVTLSVSSKEPKYQFDSSMNLQTMIVQRYRDIQQ